jgi:hypothetical protein
MAQSCWQKKEDQWPQTNIEIANICDNEIKRQKKTNSANKTDCTTLKSNHISDPKWSLGLVDSWIQT